jgi:hypothetical protein
LDERDPALLIWGQPDFHGVNVVSHALFRVQPSPGGKHP